MQLRESLAYCITCCTVDSLACYRQAVSIAQVMIEVPHLLKLRLDIAHALRDVLQVGRHGLLKPAVHHSSAKVHLPEKQGAVDIGRSKQHTVTPPVVCLATAIRMGCSACLCMSSGCSTLTSILNTEVSKCAPCQLLGRGLSAGLRAIAVIDGPFK